MAKAKKTKAAKAAKKRSDDVRVTYRCNEEKHLGVEIIENPVYNDLRFNCQACKEPLQVDIPSLQFVRSKAAQDHTVLGVGLMGVSE